MQPKDSKFAVEKSCTSASRSQLSKMRCSYVNSSPAEITAFIEDSIAIATGKSCCLNQTFSPRQELSCLPIIQKD
jgi:hypothetical protein